MKKIASIGFSWSNEYGQPPKTSEQLEQDKRRVQEILKRVGYGHAFDPERYYYDFHNVEVGSELFTVLIEELQKDPHLTRPGSISIETHYTRQELESAELLVWGPTNQAIEDDYYELYIRTDDEGFGKLYKRCSACGARLEQIRDLIVNKTLMRGKDISLTYSDEVILSERVGRLLQEQGLTGCKLRLVHHYKKPYKGEPSLYQLMVTNTLPPMLSPPTEFEHFHDCAVCGRTSRFLKHTHWWGKIQYREDTDVYYPRHVLEVVQDFNHTAEWFGEQRVMHRWIIITQRVYRLLREHKVKNWAAVPVYLVD